MDKLTGNQIYCIERDTLNQAANNIVDLIEAHKVIYNFDTHLYEVTKGCTPSEMNYGTLRKIFEFQSNYSIEERQELYSIVQKYVEIHPMIVIPSKRHKRGGRRGQKYDCRIHDLNSIIKSELGITIKSAYVVGLVQIIQNEIHKTIMNQSDCDFIENSHIIEHAIKEFNERQSIDREGILGALSDLSKTLEPFHNYNKGNNATIVDASLNSLTVLYNNKHIECPYQSICEFSLLEKMSRYDGEPISVNISAYTSKRRNELIINNIIESKILKEHIDKLTVLVTEANYLFAKRYYLTIQSTLSKYLRNDRLYLLERIRKEFDKIQLKSTDYPVIKLNCTANSYQSTTAISKKLYLDIRKQISVCSESSIEECIQNGLNNHLIQPKEKSKLYEILYESYKKSDNIVKAIETYKMWITHCEETKIASNKKICRMYTVLCKLQATVKGYEQDAIESINKAIEYEEYREFNLNLKKELLDKFGKH